MTGLIFDIRRFSIKDGPGIRTTVFLKGCPLSCIWCHNPEGKTCEIQKAERVNRIGKHEFRFEETIGKNMTIEEVMDEVSRDRITYEESGGGVTFSGGEPFEQTDFLIEVLKESKRLNLHTALDTTGYTAKENVTKILPYTDLFLYDIKHLDDEEHIKYTGVSNEIIMNNLDYIVGERKEVIIRFPIIPGINDSEKNIFQMKDFMKFYRGNINEIHLLPFHNIAERKYTKLNVVNAMKGTPSLKDTDLFPLKQEFEDIGLKVKISG